MNNHSYVCIPADKLAQIIEHCCPPGHMCYICTHMVSKGRDDIICHECWKSWLKDGE